MTERLDDVWVSRDWPVLLEIAKAIDAGEQRLTTHEIGRRLGIDAKEAFLAAKALERRGYVRLQTVGNVPQAFVLDVTGKAYLITGLHPDADDALSGLVEMLTQAADDAGDEEERSRLRRAADGLLGVSRDVMVGVMTAYATKYGAH